jgi:transposase
VAHVVPSSCLPQRFPGTPGPSQIVLEQFDYSKASVIRPGEAHCSMGECMITVGSTKAFVLEAYVERFLAP